MSGLVTKNMVRFRSRFGFSGWLRNMGLRLRSQRNPLGSFKSMAQASRMGFAVLLIAVVVLGGSTVGLYALWSVERTERERVQWELSNALGNYSVSQETYDELWEVLNEPYENLTVPTFGELDAWIQEDDTDEILYADGEWMCGDYAAMLAVKAKAKGWRIRIAVIGYSLNGESQYGVNTAWGNNGHAFNVINCTDGTYYIEPQSDSIWYYPSDPWYNMVDDIWTYVDYSGVSGTVWGQTTIWVNYYTWCA